MGKRTTKGKGSKGGRRPEHTNGGPNVDDESIATPAAPSAQSPRPDKQPAKDQYQHYIPRFILRNFALDDHLIHSRERHEIYQYSLTDKKLRIADVDTSYGVYNMYSDIQNIADLNFVEVKLSELEQAASIVIKRVVDPSRTEVEMLYPELMALKKFLWIMSFRNPPRRRQYTDERFCARGKKIQQEYMEARGRTSLDDVWLENMKGLLLDDDEPAWSAAHLSDNRGPIGLMENRDYKVASFPVSWSALLDFLLVVADRKPGISAILTNFNS
jgi:Protein of unknown function (DUF4238)